ncbi:hypothetical protein Bca52824_048867 [Brassica carinata]|uniref:Uncharacterized protein n=1 Tax=Brassica carinata TaxID=52824 RepID=A0A8X7RLP3_BRACI|nr:hypothetical protein Bca52824_048867 [Brassica carinata]
MSYYTQDYGYYAGGSQRGGLVQKKNQCGGQMTRGYKNAHRGFNGGNEIARYVRTEATNETPVSPIAPQNGNRGIEDTDAVHNTPSSLVSSLISRTSASSPLSTLFENGADVEIATSDDATCRIWYPGNRRWQELFCGPKESYCNTDKIRPKPPDDREKKKAEQRDKSNDSGENTFSVYPNSSMETLEFKASDLRIHREWLDGVWKMADGDTKEPMNENISKNISDIQRLTRARAKNLREQNKHVDVAFAMLNEKRIEQSSWFSEQGIPKDCFVPVQFLETVGYSYENLQKPDKKGINILKGWVGEVVRGLIRPNKMWMQDVDIVYGVVHERRVDHFIGVEIHLMENTITIFHCGVHKVKENPLIQKLC